MEGFMMENISLEQYTKYAQVLGLDDNFIDMRNLIFQYKAALCDCCLDCLEGAYDIDKLELITDSFLFFSKFELATTFDDVVDMLLTLGEERKEVTEYTDAEMIAIYVHLIADKIIDKDVDDVLLKRNCEVLYKIAATISPIQNYEGQYGDINTLIKELKERKGQ